MKKARIIVVDDEENIRGTLQEILTDEGYQVSCAADGETALRIIQSEAPDLVLLDVWMAGIDGIQTLKMLKNIDPDTEVVMMSGHGNIDTAVKATKIGAFDFIEKPFSLDSILRTVSKALKSRRSRLTKGKKTFLESAHNVERKFIGSSKAMKDTRRMIRSASRKPSPTLIIGEAGIGARFVARMTHSMSSRRDKSFIDITCDSIANEKSFETTLFDGPSKSSGEKLSKFELADGGVIFFDGIEQLSEPLQEKLLKILKSGCVKSIDGKRSIPFNAKIMASIILNPGENAKYVVQQSNLAKFLSATTVKLTPLRDRKDDIPELIEQFVEELCDEYGKDITSVGKQALQALVKAPWPGNVRQLKEVMEKAVLACEGTMLLKEHLPLDGLDTQYGLNTNGDINGMEETDLALAGHTPGKKAGRKRKKVKSGVIQKTLKNSVVLCGQGLHSGIKTGMILSPLPPNSGIVFGDISSGDQIPALLENVRSTEYATTLSNGRITIKTIEHIMSALHSYGISNLLIKIGDEAPIMDGSALEFCELIENSGVEEQDEMVDEIIIDKKISVGDPDDGPYLCVEPADAFSIRYSLDYPPPIGKQRYEYVHSSGGDYKDTVAPARTFGFLRDIKKLEEAGLASGGRLSNVILIDDEKVLNTPLRFPNEPARHKTLDLIGDLYLLGRPIRGHFTAKKSGHTQNIELIKKIMELSLDTESDEAKQHAVTS